MARPFAKTHAAALARLGARAHTDFGARGERTCCDGKCLQGRGICPAVRRHSDELPNPFSPLDDLGTKPGVVRRFFRALWARLTAPCV